VDRLVAALDALVQRPHEVLVAAGDERVHQLDDRDLGPQRVVHRGHLEPDDPAADDQQPARDVGELERAGGVHEPRIVVREARQAGRARPGGDDRVPEPHGRPSVLAGHGEDVGGRELGDAVHDLDLALLGQAHEAAGELADDGLLPAAQRVDVDLRLAEGDAVRRGLLRLREHLRHVEQRLGGDAAHVEAHAAERLVALDEHGLEPEIGGPEGRGVAAGPRAEHDDVALHVDLALERRRRRCDRGRRRGLGRRHGRRGAPRPSPRPRA
jgi:hypothetical protein